MLEQRVYLDNAATSFPKPESVWRALEHYQRDLGTAVGRGATHAGLEVQRVVDRCRLQAARFFHAVSPEQVIFAFNGTDALNQGIHGLLCPGDRAITTVWDHNSVLRPLRTLETRGEIEVDVIPDDGSAGVDLEAFARSLKTPTRLVAITHASNVTGAVLPVEEITQLAHEAGALVLLDAAQTAGHVEIDLSRLPVDLLACPGHKGLLGPLGTGLLILRPGVEQHLLPRRQGGTGTVSESDRQPETLPERYESGNHNAPGLFGLDAAFSWLTDPENGTLAAESELFSGFVQRLQEIPGVTVYGPATDRPRVNLVSISVESVEPQVVATLLDEHFGVEVRAGLHCSPGAHRALGTLDSGGTVRFSSGRFTTAADLDAALEAVAQVAAAM